MKKIIITLIAVLCLISLTSCKNKEIATEKEAKEFFEKLLENNFTEQTYSYSYSIKIKDNTSTSFTKAENSKKINAKGYAEVTNDLETNKTSVDFMFDCKYISKNYNDLGNKVTSKESIVVFDYCKINYYKKEYGDIYFYQKKKAVEKQTKNSTKSYIKHKSYDESMAFNDVFFVNTLDDIFDLEQFFKKILKYSLNNSLVYINGNNCKVIINEDLDKYIINLKLKDNKLKKVEITFSSPTKKSEVLIDLTKKINIKKPKDYKKYLEE